MPRLNDTTVAADAATDTGAVDAQAPETAGTPETVPAPEGLSGPGPLGTDAGASSVAAGAETPSAPVSAPADAGTVAPEASPAPVAEPAPVPVAPDGPSVAAGTAAPDVAPAPAPVTPPAAPEAPAEATPPPPEAPPDASPFAPTGTFGTTMPPEPAPLHPLDAGQVRDGQPDGHPQVRYDRQSGRFYFLTADGQPVFQDLPAGYRYDEQRGVLVADPDAPGTASPPERTWVPGADAEEDRETITLEIVHSRVGTIGERGERLSAAEVLRRNPNADLPFLVQSGAVRRVREDEEGG